MNIELITPEMIVYVLLISALLTIALLAIVEHCISKRATKKIIAYRLREIERQHAHREQCKQAAIALRNHEHKKLNRAA